MNTRLKTSIIIAGVILFALALFLNRVALHALGLKASSAAEQVADRQRLDNWEVFFHNALERLGKAIEDEGERLRDFRLSEAKERIQLERARKTMATYGGVEKELADRIKEANGAKVRAHGKLYTPEGAQAQLRQYASAVIQQRRTVAALTESLSARHAAIESIENNRDVARQQLMALRERGRQLVHDRSLAELKALSLEMSNLNAGLDPQGPLSGPLADIHGLLNQMQEHTDGLAARSEVVVNTPAGTEKLLTVQEAIRQLNYSERKKEIDQEVKQALTR